MKKHVRASRQWMWYGLIGSIVFGALLGIVVVLRDQWEWFEIRVLLTTATIAVASLCGLTCDFLRIPGERNILPLLGLVLCLVSTVMLLFGMWTDVNDDMYWKVVLCACTLALATVHVSLLGIAQLAKRFKWLMFVAYQTIYGLAFLFVYMVLDNEFTSSVVQLAIVLTIVNAAITLVIPLLHRISRAELPFQSGVSLLEKRSLVSIDEEICKLRERIADLEQARSRLLNGKQDAK